MSALDAAVAEGDKRRAETHVDSLAAREDEIADLKEKREKLRQEREEVEGGSDSGQGSYDEEEELMNGAEEISAEDEDEGYDTEEDLDEEEGRGPPQQIGQAFTGGYPQSDPGDAFAQQAPLPSSAFQKEYTGSEYGFEDRVTNQSGSSFEGGGRGDSFSFDGPSSLTSSSFDGGGQSQNGVDDVFETKGGRDFTGNPFAAGDNPFDSGSGTAVQGSGKLRKWRDTSSKLRKVKRRRRQFDRKPVEITREKIELVRKARIKWKRAREDVREAKETENLRKIVTTQIAERKARRDYYEARNQASPIGVPASSKKNGWWNNYGQDDQDETIEDEDGGYVSADPAISEDVGDFIESKTLSQRDYYEDLPRTKVKVEEGLGFIITEQAKQAARRGIQTIVGAILG
ncbi:MAG: hypothetical protein H6925_05610 [Holosporaceae bacterium]|nr:MAG: hypothetical protein H6925_05610 [Holosporaceae bacterium]